jgi:hypothetical protein
MMPRHSPEGTRKWNQAARFVAEGELEHGAIAARVGIAPNTLWRWRQNPKFAVRVTKYSDRINESVPSPAITHRARRLERLNRDWFRLQAIIDERAADPSMEGVPGGKTGLIVRKVKRLLSGDRATLVSEYTIDCRILRELRRIEKQAALECGQWEPMVNEETACSVSALIEVDAAKAVHDAQRADEPSESEGVPLPGRLAIIPYGRPAEAA